MLVISSRLHDRVKIEVGDIIIWVGVVKLDKGKVRLGFEAPPEARISRNEVLPLAEQYPDGAKTPIILERS